MHHYHDILHNLILHCILYYLCSHLHCLILPPIKSTFHWTQYSYINLHDILLLPSFQRNNAFVVTVNGCVFKVFKLNLLLSIYNGVKGERWAFCGNLQSCDKCYSHHKINSLFMTHKIQEEFFPQSRMIFCFVIAECRSHAYRMWVCSNQRIVNVFFTNTWWYQDSLMRWG